MKNAIIYVFSGSGNTKKAAMYFADEFRRNGVNATLFDITLDFQNVPSPNDFDYVGIAYPIHGFNAPYIVLDFARSLPVTPKGKKIFTVKTSGEPLHLNDISSLKMMRILSRKGYELNAEYHYAMPYNMIFRHTDKRAVQMNDTLKELAPIEAREVLAEKKHLLKRIPFGGAIAWLFRIEHPAMKVNGRFFKIDQTKCVHCGKCSRNCPAHNITMNADGSFSFGSDCIMCTRCSFNCPTDAFNIALLNNWRVNGRYDIEHPKTDETDKHARYCKKAYQRYFDDAAKKIEANKGGNTL